MSLSKIAIITISKTQSAICDRAVKRVEIPVDIIEISNVEISEAINLMKMKVDECEERGIEFILARSGGSFVLQGSHKLTIIDMDITNSDILQALIKYQGSGKKIAAVDCQTNIDKIKFIGDTINIPVTKHLANHANAKEKILEAIGQGADVIVGASGSFQESEKALIASHGKESETISISEHTVVQAIQKAHEFLSVQQKEREYTQILRTTLNFSEQGILQIDENGVVVNSNPKAVRILDCDFASGEHGTKISDIIANFPVGEVLEQGLELQSIVFEFNGKPIVYDCIPIIVAEEILGAVVYIIEAKQIEEKEHKLRAAKNVKGFYAKRKFSDIFGESDALTSVIKLAKNYSNTDSTVLIHGETGTGKEVFAQAIHNSSLRQDKPFVAINCAAISPSLLESELFGYEAGSFTGANKGGKAGYFELAHEGTIFLDEIGEVDKSVQLNLLRVIQEREIMRVGGDKIIPVNVRIIAATNKNLYEEVQKGNFREDLYFRLDVLSLKIPPLRERKGDVAVLAQGFLKQLNTNLKCNVIGIDKELQRAMDAYHWPGNIRELLNILERIITITKTGIIKYHEVAPFLNFAKGDKNEGEQLQLYNLTLEEAEKKMIFHVLREEQYNKVKTAQRLGINRTTLFRKLDKYIAESNANDA